MLWSLIVRSSVCYGRPVTGTEFRLLLNYANVMIALEVENAQQMEKRENKNSTKKTLNTSRASSLTLKGRKWF